MSQLTIPQALQIAIKHHQEGRFAEAEGIYRLVLQQRPNHPDALHLLGVLAGQAGRKQEAVDLVKRAIAACPTEAAYHCNLGKFLADQNQLDEAIVAYREALWLRPNLAEAHNNLGNVLKEKAMFDEAVASYGAAIRYKADYAEAYHNWGNALKDQGKLAAAIPCYEAALRIRPDYAAAHTGLGDVYTGLGRYAEAVACLETAIRLQPNLAEAHANLGNALRDIQRTGESIAAYRRSLALQSDNAAVHSNLLLALNYQAADPQSLLGEANNWAARHAAPVERMIPPPRPQAKTRDPERRLRIGYVSPDFRSHPVSSFLLPLLKNQDHEQFEIVCYSDVVSPDSTTANLRGLADAWHSIAGLSDAAAADLVRAHGIDILVDLAGHTAQNRLLAFARKPAPVQISYLGYPGTTGLRAIDYRITDAGADPPGMTEAFYTETLWRLPETAWCFEAPDDAPEVLPSTATEGRPIVFGSFNHFAKVSPETGQLWARVMHAVPGSHLVLKSKGLGDAASLAQIRPYLSACGIDLERITLLDRIAARGSHLAAYAAIDIALDTFPYHGTTTTCEALWMGVPVITLAGSTHVSRVGVSLLHNAGVAELIAASADDYVKKAAALAGDGGKLAYFHKTLRYNMRASPLMDAPRFAAHFEAACRATWRNWCEKGNRAL